MKKVISVFCLCSMLTSADASDGNWGIRFWKNFTSDMRSSYGLFQLTQLSPIIESLYHVNGKQTVFTQVLYMRKEGEDTCRKFTDIKKSYDHASLDEIHDQLISLIAINSKYCNFTGNKDPYEIKEIIQEPCVSIGTSIGCLSKEFKEISGGYINNSWLHKILQGTEDKVRAEAVTVGPK